MLYKGTPEATQKKRRNEEVCLCVFNQSPFKAVTESEQIFLIVVYGKQRQRGGETRESSVFVDELIPKENIKIQNPLASNDSVKHALEGKRWTVEIECVRCGAMQSCCQVRYQMEESGTIRR